MKTAYDDRSMVSIDTSDIDALLNFFRSKDGAARQWAREQLVRIGKPAVPRLLPLLSHPDDLIRWEACKTLEKIRDPHAAAALANALLDDNMDVRWVAADALIELEHRAIIPVLEIIERHYDSVLLREAAHHVLTNLKRAGFLDEELEMVAEALTVNELPSKAAFAAIRVLDDRRTKVR